MLDLPGLVVQHFQTFVLVFCRLGAMLAFAPVFGHRSLSMPHRAALALLLALVLTPVLSTGRPQSLPDLLGLVLAVGGELVIGVAIAFIAQLVVGAVLGAGEIVGVQMGLGIASLYDPAQGEQANVLTRFYEFFGLLLFLTVNGHHLLLQAVAGSFQRIRPGAGPVYPTMAGGLTTLGGKVFRSGLELAAPLVGILLVLNVAMALLAKAAPQTNAFFLAVPVTLALGIFGIIETFPAFATAVTRMVSEAAADFDAVLVGATGGLR